MQEWMSFSVQDTGSGLKTIVVNTAVNVNVTIPAFAQGTTAPVTVTATKPGFRFTSVEVMPEAGASVLVVLHGAP